MFCECEIIYNTTPFKHKEANMATVNALVCHLCLREGKRLEGYHGCRSCGAALCSSHSNYGRKCQVCGSTTLCANAGDNGFQGQAY